MREEGSVLEDQADPASFRRQVSEVGSGEADLAGVPGAEPGDGFQEHGLASPGRPEDDQDPVGRDVQVDRADAEGPGLAGQPGDGKAAVSCRHG